MKKLILLFSVLFSFSLYADDIQIFDFESDFTGKWGTNGNPTNDQYNEDHVNFTIADNPSATGINTSDKVGKFHRLSAANSGFWWAYAWFEFPSIPIAASVTQPKYLHISIYKPLISTVCVQLRDANGSTVTNTTEIKNNKQTKTNEWQELVFKLTTTGTLGFIAVKPDFVNPSAASSDIDIYFDNIYLSDDPSPVGEEPYKGDLPEDFEGEYTLLNPDDYFGEMFAPFIQTISDTDLSVADNPSQTGINTSSKCGKFIRKKEGPWNAGFYMLPRTAITADADNKYMHVMIYKTIESPINLKLENGTPNANSGDIKVTPVSEDVGKWVDYVFEVPSDKYGTYGKISIFPDFINETMSDRLTEDLIFYFDNLEFNNDPDPRTTPGEPTHLNRAEASSAISVWTDASGNIHINNASDKADTFRLFDMLGKQLKTIEITPGKTLIPMEGFSGIYILKGNKTTYKVMLP